MAAACNYAGVASILQALSPLLKLVSYLYTISPALCRIPDLKGSCSQRRAMAWCALFLAESGQYQNRSIAESAQPQHAPIPSPCPHDSCYTPYHWLAMHEHPCWP